MKILSLQKLQLMFIIMCTSTIMFAQPANDNCSTPTLMVVGADAASCIPVTGDTRGTVDATTVPGPIVCSGTWFTDDVWYSVETGADIPPNGITIEVRLDPSSGTELIQQGMAIYSDCDAASEPFECFSDAPGRRILDFPAVCLTPNSTFLVRVWSAPDPRTNSGTFSICAYETPAPAPERVIFEETFDKGFNGWQSISQSQSLDITTGEMVDDHWLWTDTGCLPTAFNNGISCISTEAICSGMEGIVGVPAGFYQSERDGDQANIPLNGPWGVVNTFLVSPSIDLSKESCVNLRWTEAGRFLSTGGVFTQIGPYVQYSIDDGETWVNPSEAIGTADVAVNYGGEYIENAATTNGLERSIPLIGAEGNTNVRIRFGFEGNFYQWMIDNIRIVEGTAADGIAQNNFFARAHINPMSIHMVDSYDFLIDIANLSCEDLTNANVNMSITNSAGDEMHNVDLPYGTITSDFLDENRSFLQPFTPPAVADNYTATYTLSADIDDDLNNNVRSFQASVVDETVFRKENGDANGAISPNPAVFWQEDNEVFTWEIGNMFYAPNGSSVTGDPLRFNEISFQLNNPEDLVGDLLNVFVYEVFDNDFDNIVSKGDDSELIRLGGNSYTVTGTEEGLITVELFSFNGDEDELFISPNTHYLATVETATTEVRAQAMALAQDDSYQYSAAIFNAQQTGFANEDLTQNRYSHAFAITKENYFRIGSGFSGDNTTGNFGDNVTPIIRLGYEIVEDVSTVEINNDIAIAVSPNPTASELAVNLSIKESTDMIVSIVDLTGRVIFTRSLNGVTEAREEFNVGNLANGVYMVHIDTKKGVRTEKFVVSK